MALLSDAKPIFKSGVTGAIGNYVYDQFLGARIQSAVGNFAGAWTDLVIASGVALGVARFGKGKPWARDVAVSLIAHRGAIAAETQFPSIGGGGGAGTGAKWYQQVASS